MTSSLWLVVAWAALPAALLPALYRLRRHHQENER